MRISKKIPALLITLSIFLVACTSGGDMSSATAKVKAEDFVSTVLLRGQVKATVKSIESESNLYKLELEIPGNQSPEPIITYMTKDGSKFFLEALNIAELTEKAKPVKKAKPEVELFVMSHCPFGTQIEKGIIPVLDTLGDKVDFKLKFVDYAMHGETEIKEELNQYCIQKNEPEKLIAYLKSFLGDEDSSKALAAAGISVDKLEACVAETDKEFEVMAKFEDKANWGSKYPPFNVDKAANEQYNVGGSPTLVVNGKTAEGVVRDSASLLSKICEGFETAPTECQVSMSSVVPEPGFGYAEGTAPAAPSSGTAGCSS
jgi:protein-disulfide isomerase